MTAPSPHSPTLVVVKIGSSSLTDETGAIDDGAITRVCRQVAALREQDIKVVVVTSAAVASGLGALGFAERPTDVLTLQAVSAVGQSRLMHRWDSAFAAVGLVSGQVLLTPNDFFSRGQYLHARATLARLLELGVVPVINENDTIASQELRFGDNDRISALVAHLIDADLLVLLTDTAGLYDADPRANTDALLIEHVDEVTAEIEALAAGAGTARGSGGMSSKLRAAKMAAWSGVRAVIGDSRSADALAAAVEGRPGAGTTVAAMDQRISARKLWIGFAGDASGTLRVDAGAERALRERGVSLLPAGVVDVDGEFEVGDIVEIAGPSTVPFARGMARIDADIARAVKGQRLGADGEVVVHRDDLVLLP